MEIRRLMRRSGDCLQGVIITKENFSETLTPKIGRELVVYERLLLVVYERLLALTRKMLLWVACHLWEVVLYKPSRRPRDITFNT